MGLESARQNNESAGHFAQHAVWEGGMLWRRMKEAWDAALQNSGAVANEPPTRPACHVYVRHVSCDSRVVISKMMA